MFKHVSIFSVALACIAPASFAQQKIVLPPALSGACSDLAELTYWASTAHLAKRDKDRLARLEGDARKPNASRQGIPEAMIREAVGHGLRSHGNAGPGLKNLDEARSDGIITALMVYQMCLEGKLLQ